MLGGCIEGTCIYRGTDERMLLDLRPGSGGQEGLLKSNALHHEGIRSIRIGWTQEL